MNQLSVNPIKRTSQNVENVQVLIIDQGTLSHITDFIQVVFSILNGLIGLRFLLKLIAANPANPLVNLLYLITSPFLWMFRELRGVNSFAGIQVELFSLVAIIMYTILAWFLVQLVWLTFARPNS